jgi:Ca2+-binding RTX toxin-like protein
VLLRRLVVLAAVAAVALVAAASAQASTICRGGTDYCFGSSFYNVIYRAATGEQNNVTVTQNSDRTVTVTDTGATITLTQNSGCTSVDAHTAKCPLSPAPTANDPEQNSALLFQLGEPDVNNTTNPDNDTFTSNLTGFSDKDTIDLTVQTGRGNDNVTGSDSNFVYDEIQTGTGDDTASGRGGADTITDLDGSQPVQAGQFRSGGNNTFDGGAGEDTIIGGQDTDKITGGPDSDFIQPDSWPVTEDANGKPVVPTTNGNDTVDGGEGFDEIYYQLPPAFDAQGDPADIPPTTAGAKITLPDPGATTSGNGIAGENDSLTSIEDAVGTVGADTIVGSKVSNQLFGGSGNDSITGGAGVDLLSGGGDDDTLNANDGEADRVDCGGQAGDKANIDQFDSTTGCPAVGAGTTVIQTAPPTTPVVIPPVDKSPPVIKSIKAPKRIKAKVLKKKGYKFTLTLKDPTETDRLIADLEARIGNKLAITSAAGYATLAEKRKSSFKGHVTMTLKIAKKLQKALKKGKGMRLFIQVTDQAGNTTPKRIKIHIT